MPAPLSRELAQRVVDQVSPTLEHNINVMDRTGIIIASSDSSRIGTLHAGAREAAGTGRPAIIRAGDESEGVRPGVNLPLALDGDIVGVVGLTGEPLQVTPVAQVLVLTIELLLTRERELDASARREARDRDLLSRLVNGRLGPDAVTAAFGRESPTLRPPWRLSAIVAPESAGSPTSRLPDALQDITRRIDAHGRFRFAPFQGALWVLSQASDLDDLALAEASAGVLLLRGDACPDPIALDGSAKTIAALVARPCFIPSATGILRTAELTAELAVACMPAETAKHLAQRIAALSQVHRATVATYLDSGHSVSATARVLFTHRNTVIQRLDRAAELTGLDPRLPRQSVTFQLALVAARRTGQNNHISSSPAG
ncbi:MAG: putative CdaR family transcriptional regulator [Homoserinimonas sp.]|nr:putative CdaR family transcriptional regulator [Homoserinimonas sp.]